MLFNLKTFVLVLLYFPPSEERIPWNSNIVVDRVSNNVVKTVSGRIYVLVNRMKMSSDSGRPDNV